MANILHVEAGDWASLESSPRPVFVDFWAEWCAPCRMLAPTFEKLAETYGHAITFAKVDVDELPEIGNKYAIRSIPTLMLIQGGEVRERVVGLRSQQELAQILDRYAAVPQKP